jgi:hypothetical protein
MREPQGFEVYQKETLVCRWKKTTWWRTSNAQQKRGEEISITEILYQNDYLEAQDDGLPIHDKSHDDRRSATWICSSLTLATML